MKTTLKIGLATAAVAIIGWAGHALAQSAYKISNTGTGNMKLSGTSTFHNWIMNAGTFTGAAQFDFAAGAGGKMESIKSLSFSLPVTNLKSDNSGLNKNAYKALKSGEFKNILYTLTSSSIAAGSKANSYIVKAIGDLTIAGITHPVTMNVSCTVNSDETVTCSGSQALKMTDYNVKPPTFMMGAMKTGDAITLAYTLVYKK